MTGVYEQQQINQMENRNKVTNETNDIGDSTKKCIERTHLKNESS